MKECENWRQCAIATLLWIAKEGGPQKTIEPSVSCSPLNRNKAEVGKLYKRPVHQTTLICIPEFLFQVQKYVILSLENTHAGVEGRDGHGRGDSLVAQHLGQDGARRAARQRALQQALPHVVEVGVEGHGHGGHAPRLPPVGRAAAQSLLQRVTRREERAVEQHVRGPRVAPGRARQRPPPARHAPRRAPAGTRWRPPRAPGPRPPLTAAGPRRLLPPPAPASSTGSKAIGCPAQSVLPNPAATSHSLCGLSLRKAAGLRNARSVYEKCPEEKKPWRQKAD